MYCFFKPEKLLSDKHILGVVNKLIRKEAAVKLGLRFCMNIFHHTERIIFAIFEILTIKKSSTCKLSPLATRYPATHASVLMGIRV